MLHEHAQEKRIKLVCNLLLIIDDSIVCALLVYRIFIFLKCRENFCGE